MSIRAARNAGVEGRAYAPSVRAIASALMLVGGGAAVSSLVSATPAGAAVTGNISISQVQNTAMYYSAVKMANLVKKYTHGAVQLKVYPNSELGSSTAILQGCEAGTIAVCAEAGLGTAVDAVQVPQTPWMFPSFHIMQEAVNSAPVLADLRAQFKPANLTFLGFWGVGGSDIMTVSKAVLSPGDLRGLRLRVANAYLGSLEYDPLKADPVSLPSTEITSALSTHTIDGMDEPITTMLSAGWTSEMHYLSILNDAFIQTPVAASSKFIASLPADDQSAVERAFQQTLGSNIVLANKDEDAALTSLKKSGVDVLRPATAPFQKADAGIVSEVEKTYPIVTKLLLKETKKLEAKAAP